MNATDTRLVSKRDAVNFGAPVQIPHSLSLVPLLQREHAARIYNGLMPFNLADLNSQWRKYHNAVAAGRSDAKVSFGCWFLSVFMPVGMSLAQARDHWPELHYALDDSVAYETVMCLLATLGGRP